MLSCEALAEAGRRCRQKFVEIVTEKIRSGATLNGLAVDTMLVDVANLDAAARCSAVQQYLSQMKRWDSRASWEGRRGVECPRTSEPQANLFAREVPRWQVAAAHRAPWARQLEVPHCRSVLQQPL